MFEKIKKDIDKELGLYLKEVSGELKIKKISPLLYSAFEDFLKRGGKRIRPILFTLSYLGHARDKKASYKNVIRCSLSMELLHDFLLVHDDVIDKSPLRRGKATLHRLFNAKLSRGAKDEIGSNLSIVAGDIISDLAIDAFLSLNENPVRMQKALLAFTRTAAFTGMGEFLDVLNDIKDVEDITKKDVFLTYTLKTAKYTFEGPLVIGAMLTGSDNSELGKLSQLGIMLGQAFQMQDDLLDVFSSSKKIGKPVLSDLNESKKTLLIWKAYNTLSGREKKLLKRLLEKKKKTYKDLLNFRKLIKVSGADEYCRKKIQSILAEGNQIVSGLKMRRKHKDALLEFIETIF